jgi:mycoredoxin
MGMGRGVDGFHNAMTQPTEQNALDLQNTTDLDTSSDLNTGSVDNAGVSQQVTFYWRPGCPFCSSLRAGLDRAGVAHADVNIWDDPAGAAFVRSVANGNETVPTVTVGTTSLVNPTPDQVVRLQAQVSAGR